MPSPSNARPPRRHSSWPAPASSARVRHCPDREGLLHDGFAVSGTGSTGIFRNQPFTLTVDLAGNTPVPVVASGIIGGPAVPVPTGVYRVEVLSDPVEVFPDIDLDPGETVELTVGPQEAPGS